MQVNRSWIAILSVAFIGISLLLIFNYWPKTASQVTPDPFGQTSGIDKNSKGTVGYVILKNKSIYFLDEKNLPDDDIDNIEWSKLSGVMGHPADAVLVGESINAIEKELSTGDKVEIWYSQIRESYPGQIVVEHIEKH